jgi:hypothetical protein
MPDHPSNIQKHIQQALSNCSGGETIVHMVCIQHLWSNYGQLCRVVTDARRSIIAKVVDLKGGSAHGRAHPRARGNDIGHLRKVKSYQIENNWYKSWSQWCSAECRVPHVLWAECDAEVSVLLLEDMDGAGFSERRHRVSEGELESCLRWLAYFHGIFLGQAPEGLWPTGTYWHLDTRPEELKALGSSPLRKAASPIDLKLKQAKYQTFVHGDAKLENFCFSAAPAKVCAVDFQYVGGGCGMKDVVYFLGSCRSDAECERRESQHLEMYFKHLREACGKHRHLNFDELEEEWRTLYPVAWTDFYRFLQGWSPGYIVDNGYSERCFQRALEVVL